MVIIYGINKITPLIHAQYKHSLVKFVTTKGGEKYGNTESLSIDKFAELDYESIDKVIICSMYVSVITESLKGVNFPMERVFAFNCNKCCVEPVKIRSLSPTPENTLISVFDLKTNLASYDIVNFLYLSEAERLKRSLDYIQFLIIPEYDSNGVGVVNNHHDEADVQWRIDHIFLGLANSLPSHICTTQLSNREQATRLLSNNAHIFPENYSIATPPPQFTFQDIVAEGLSLDYIFDANKSAKKILSDTVLPRVNGRKMIAVTLREYDAQPMRNSNLEGISAFLQELDSKIYFPILIRDTYKVGSEIGFGLDNYLSLDSASIDTSLRVAIYQAAYLNLSVSTGPSYLFYFIKNCRSIEFRWIDNNVFTMTKELMEYSGFPELKQPLIASKHQMVMWEKDTSHNLTEAFKKYLQEGFSQ